MVFISRPIFGAYLSAQYESNLTHDNRSLPVVQPDLQPSWTARDDWQPRSTLYFNLYDCFFAVSASTCFCCSTIRPNQINQCGWDTCNQSDLWSKVDHRISSLGSMVVGSNFVFVIMKTCASTIVVNGKILIIKQIEFRFFPTKDVVICIYRFSQKVFLTLSVLSGRCFEPQAVHHILTVVRFVWYILWYSKHEC